jgi:DNA-binding transcriptional regulator YbjK
LSPAKRDPEGRRRALASAAVEVIADSGVGRTTHRAVAARAGVPLGATTYYFPTLNDLVVAGLQQASDAMQAELDGWAGRLTAGNLAPTLVELSRGYLADRPRAILEYEVYLAAARDEQLRPLAQAWLDGLYSLLTPLTDPFTARAVAMLLDGALAQALATGSALDGVTLQRAITRLLG